MRSDRHRPRPGQGAQLRAFPTVHYVTALTVKCQQQAALDLSVRGRRAGEGHALRRATVTNPWNTVVYRSAHVLRPATMWIFIPPSSGREPATT